MAVRQAAARVTVGVRLAGRNVSRVGMLVVFVVHVGMFVLQRLVDVLVRVPLDEVQV